MAAETVTIRFLGKASGTWPRAQVREVFGLVDNLLQDLAEPAEITIPVKKSQFDSLYNRAQAISRGEQVAKTQRAPKSSNYLLYNYGWTGLEIATQQLDCPNLAELFAASPKIFTKAIIQADRADLYQLVETPYLDHEIDRLIVKYRAKSCLARRIERNPNSEWILRIAKTEDMCTPVLEKLKNFSLPCEWTPEAIKYSYLYAINNERDPPLNISWYLHAACKLDDVLFATTLVMNDADSSEELRGVDAQEILNEVKSVKMFDVLSSFADTESLCSLADKHGVPFDLDMATMVANTRRKLEMVAF